MNPGQGAPNALPLFTSAKGDPMTTIIPLHHQPRWQLDGADWIMLVGNRVVALLVPNSCDLLPQFHWLSRFVGDGEYPDHGWDSRF